MKEKGLVSKLKDGFIGLGLMAASLFPTEKANAEFEITDIIVGSNIADLCWNPANGVDRYIIKESNNSPVSPQHFSFCGSVLATNVACVPYDPIGNQPVFYLVRSVDYRDLNDIDAGTASLLDSIMSTNFNPSGEYYDIEFIGVENVDASSQGLTSLEGLELVSEATHMNFSGNSITDLSPLGGLENLVSLNVSSNSALTDLSSFTNNSLRSLNILGSTNLNFDTLYGANPGNFGNVEISAGAGRIVAHFPDNALDNSVRAGIISKLNPVNYVYMVDLLAPSNFPSTFDLSNVSIDNLEGMQNMHVTNLNLYNNNYTNISPVGKIEELCTLNISYNPYLDDLSGLTNPCLSKIILRGYNTNGLTSNDVDILDTLYVANPEIFTNLKIEVEGGAEAAYFQDRALRQKVIDDVSVKLFPSNFLQTGDFAVGFSDFNASSLGVSNAQGIHNIWLATNMDFSDNGITSVMPFNHPYLAKNLESLNLADNSITDIGSLAKFVQDRNPTKFSYLDVRGNSLNAASTGHIATIEAGGVTVDRD